MVIKERNSFKYGQIDELEDRSIPIGAASSAYNWLTKGDKIELRRGFQFIGDEVEGLARVSGGIKVVKADGTEQLWKSNGKKVMYLDTVTDTWTELGTDILGTAADGEDVSFAIYVTNAGYQLWISSPNSVLIKVMIANPGSYSDMYTANTNYKGYLTIKTNRMFMWGLTNDKTGVYLSHIDEQNYTTVSAESLGSGSGITGPYTGTLAFKSGGSKRTCFGVVITNGTESFRDDYNGNLIGSLGGTGTINYTTGAYSVTFASAHNAAMTATYQWEDSTNGGIADFTYSATRLAGEGLIIRQDEGGGDMQNLLFLSDTALCFHKLKTWALTLGADDTTAVNAIYRESLGIPSRGAAWIVNEGIMLVDVSDKSNPEIRLVSFGEGSSEIVDRSVSRNINLSGYNFDQCVAQRYDDLSLVACKTDSDNDDEVNNRVLLYNHTWQSFDWLDYFCSCFMIYNGVLHAGDSASVNVQELFSAFDDDDALIGNEWQGHLDDLDDPHSMKKCKRFVVYGDIGPDGIIRVFASVDNGPYGEILAEDGTEAIRGDGLYVDTNNSVAVGSSTVGRDEVGGGSDGVTAYHYERMLKLQLDKMQNVKLKFVASGVGYHSISGYKWWDIRTKHQRNPQKYRVY